MGTNAERSAQNSAAALIGWARTKDRTARTEPGRQAQWRRFLDMADGDPVRAEEYRLAHMRLMTVRSLRARAAKKAKRQAQVAEWLHE